MKPAPCSFGDDQWHLVAAAELAFRIEREHGIVGGQNGATAVAKYRARALIGNDLHDDLGPGHGLAGQRMGLRTHQFRAFSHASIMADAACNWLFCPYATHHRHTAAERGWRTRARGRYVLQPRL
jgi:hypothetical protein